MHITLLHIAIHNIHPTRISRKSEHCQCDQVKAAALQKEINSSGTKQAQIIALAIECPQVRLLPSVVGYMGIACLYS
jgi:hypothetical protein